MINEDILNRNLPENFQRLTPEDKLIYGDPKIVRLSPPLVDDPRCLEKRKKWVEWRAAPYPARRHAEYLYIPGEEKNGGPNILLSAILEIPESLEDYITLIPGKNRYTIRGRKAINHGYSARAIFPHEHSRSIWEIVHSSDTRQGRPIAQLYAERPPDYPFEEYLPYGNPHYEDICCGVFSPQNRLVAYLLGKRVGDHVQYDEIMGHADHLYYDITYLLHFQFLELCIQRTPQPRFLNYGPWYSGENPFSLEGGLNRWKRRVGFQPAYLILASS
jgi:hypothetical protein